LTLTSPSSPPPPPPPPPPPLLPTTNISVISAPTDNHRIALLSSISTFDSRKLKKVVK